MDNKGQMLGLVLVAFIGVIVALVLFQASADQVGQTAVTQRVVNTTVTSAAYGQTVDLAGQELLSTVYLTNNSVDVSGNFTVYEGVSPTTGVKTILLKTTNTTWASKPLNVSYTYGAAGYIEDSGAAAIASLIVIFTALAVAVVILVPVLRSEVLSYIGR